jgi:hypothetical protein
MGRLLLEITIAKAVPTAWRFLDIVTAPAYAEAPVKYSSAA